MEIKEIIDPLDKLKIRPKPQVFVKSVFFIDNDNKEEAKECIFNDNTKHVKINRKDILANIMNKNKNVFLPSKVPVLNKPAVVHKKIVMKPSEDSDSESDEEKKEDSESDEERKEEKKVEKKVEKKEDKKQEKKKPDKKEKKKENEKKEEIEDELIESDELMDRESDDEEKGEIRGKNKIRGENKIKGVVAFDPENPNRYVNLLNPEELLKGMPIKNPLNIKTSTYYLNNRKLFIEKLEKTFSDYKKQAEQEPNDELLLHQRIAREYLNLYTPYRGLLLFYGLGTGKSATAVAIAEGLKSDKQIFLMIPASLETNFINEIKKFGDPIYRKSQHWVFVSIDGQPENITILSNLLNVPRQEIKKNKGAWLMNIHKPSNFDSLNTTQKNEIDKQLIEMIKSKYYQINYNANNLKRKIDELCKNNTVNPFDNSVVIVDEAHKLVSLIVNKLNANKGKKDGQEGLAKKFVAIHIYRLLMNASNCRIVLLTGTPIVNYPNEIAVLFNILRGSIKTWEFKIRNDKKKIDRDLLLELFYKNNLYTYDYVSINNGRIQITRNPFGFVNKYTEPAAVHKGGTQKHKEPKQNITRRQQGGKGEFDKYTGVKFDETGNITDPQFEQNIMTIFQQNNIQVVEPTIVYNKVLPDSLDEFNEKFLNIENVENPKFRDKLENIFIKRILGLSSFYRVSDNDPNLPTLIDEKTDLFHIQYCPMSEHQYALYRDIRKAEVAEQKNAIKNKDKKDDDIYKVSSSYRVYSRTCCNFAFPTPPGRPRKGKGKKGEDEIDEDEIDGEISNPIDILVDGEELPNPDKQYKDEINNAIKYLKDNEETLFSPEGLQTYSPKFLKILENIRDPDHVGLHLLYSQFRTLEGIGIFQSVLEANGFVHFKLKKVGSEWQIQPMAPGKPAFVLYTGTEEQEERELVRNIYNGDWGDIPSNLRDELIKISPNNLYGEVIKVMMITSSAAEGINLRNTRFVHLMEPYWHMVRLQQVIGRARRYQSHIGLPKKYQNVKVFLYLASFSEDQQYKINHTIGEGELKGTDVSKRAPFPLFTTDQTLFEMADIKIKISNEILKSVKSASVDCQLHHKPTDSYSCYDFGNVSSNAFSFKPNMEEDILEKAEEKKAVDKIVGLTIRDVQYFAYFNEKNDPQLTQYNLYSDKRLKTIAGVFDKVSKKMILKK
jgi:hypothetical protein